jgi:predicted nucleic acid-binding protein
MNSSLVLVDTSVWISALRRDGKIKIREEVEKLLLEEKIVTIKLIILELLRGSKTQKEYHELLTDFLALSILKISEEVWQTAFKLTLHLKTKGLLVPVTDLLIASAAIVHNCILLHEDKHFDLISNFSPLKAKNIISSKFHAS